MKMIDMTCPKCSAVLKVDDKKEKAVCEYCGYQVLIEREDTPEELRAKAHAESYGYHKGRLDAEAEAQEEAEKGAKDKGKISRCGSDFAFYCIVSCANIHFHTESQSL